MHRSSGVKVGKEEEGEEEESNEGRGDREGGIFFSKVNCAVEAKAGMRLQQGENM